MRIWSALGLAAACCILVGLSEGGGVLRSFPSEPSMDYKPLFTTHRMSVGDVSLDVGLAGKRDGRMIVFLHGFPEGKEVWDDVARRFTKNYAVVAPDQRGYHNSDKPTEIEAYKVELLAQDINNMIKKVSNGKKVLLVAHDWGGLVGWTYAHLYPETLDGFVVMNCPHPNAYQDLYRVDKESQDAASYLLKIVNHPWIMRQAMSAFNYKALQSTYNGKLRPEIMDKLIESWSVSLETQMNWYLANAQCGNAWSCDWSNLDLLFPRPLTVTVPTVFVWGKDDPMYLEKNCEGLDKYVKDLQVVKLSDAAHFPNVDQPEKVANVIDSFIQRIWKK